MDKTYQLVLDQSTSGTKLLLFQEGKILQRYDKKHRQIYPKVGWVEHDPLEIWQNVQELLVQVFQDQAITADQIVSLSLTNQRETIVAWDRLTGNPLYNAIVWQCNRSAAICEELTAQGWILFFRFAAVIDTICQQQSCTTWCIEFLIMMLFDDLNVKVSF